MNRSSRHSIRVVISGGGTGGHVFPAIAIADRLRQEMPDAGVLFVGARGRMEMEKVPAAGYPIEGLWISGLQRRLTLGNLLFPVKVLKSLYDAWRIVRRFRPDVAVGVGGYASGPTLFASSLMGVPTLIQEQNSFAGITNRLLAKRVDRVCVAYPGLERFFPAGRIVMTGNPVRAAMVDIEGKKDEALRHFGLHPGKPVLLAMGGSLGALAINQAIERELPRFRDEGLQVIWQTGSSYAEQASAVASGYTGMLRTQAFIREMDLAYAAADIIVCRAGAITVSELCIVGKPAILVPSPFVAEDHQTHNAKALADEGAAILVRQAEIEERLGGVVIGLAEDALHREELGKRIRALALPEATASIVAEVLKLAERRTKR